MTRLQSQKLMQSIAAFTDFPILLETWRTILEDEFDMENLQRLLEEIELGEIQWSHTRTASPSPLARATAWRQINEYMYMTDEPSEAKPSSLSDDLLQELLFSENKRPRLAPEIITPFVEKRQRTRQGYSPTNSQDLIDWVKERLIIPQHEWNQLLETITAETEHSVEKIISEAAPKLVFCQTESTPKPFVCALECVAGIAQNLYKNKSLRVRAMDSGQRISLPRKPSKKADSFSSLQLIEEWLQFYGPVTPDRIVETLMVDRTILDDILTELTTEQQIVRGPLVAEDNREYLCDSENFKTMVRMSRRAQKEAITPKPARELICFLQQHQRLTVPQKEVQSIQKVIEQLLFCPIKASLWEADVLPLRVDNYKAEMLEELLRESDLEWIGTKGQKISFTFESERHLMAAAKPLRQKRSLITDLFTDTEARYDFSALTRKSGIKSTELIQKLWNEMWNGELSCDCFEPVRKGVDAKFKMPKDELSQLHLFHKTRPVSFSRWKQQGSIGGNWFLLPSIQDADLQRTDLITETERQKERVRILLDRYGIIFREIIQQEHPIFQWPRIFRALRLMELSGEIVGGHFFEGIKGLQFLSRESLQAFQSREKNRAIFWINACDPISLSSMGIEGLPYTLPRRIETNHVVYRGSELILISEGHGRKVTITIPPDDPATAEALGVFNHLLNRDMHHLKCVRIEYINEKKAAQSPYAPLFQEHFDCNPTFKTLTLYKKNKDPILF